MFQGMEILATYYSYTDRYGNYIRDVLWQNTFKLNASTALFEWMYIYLIEYARSSLIHF